jgi:hypothetical protein
MPIAKTQNRGAIYCAIGSASYLEAALITAIAFRKLNPGIPATLICDRALSRSMLSRYGITPIVIEIESIERFASRGIKTRLGHISPYDETLYLDADILPLKPVAEIWDYLNQADLALVIDRTPTIGQCNHIAVEEKHYTLGLLNPNTLQYNGGLLLWRKSQKADAFFSAWHTEWQRFQRHDQLALVRAVAKTGAIVIPLPLHYNISPFDAAKCGISKSAITGLHCWGGHVESGRFRQMAQRLYPEIVATVASISGEQ